MAQSQAFGGCTALAPDVTAGPAAVQAAVHSSTGSSAHLQGGLMRVPEVDLPIQGGGGQHLAIGAPRQRQHIMLQGGEGGQQRVDGVHSIAIRHLGLQNISTGTTKQSSSRFGRCSPAGRASSRVPAGGAGPAPQHSTAGQRLVNNYDPRPKQLLCAAGPDMPLQPADQRLALAHPLPCPAPPRPARSLVPGRRGEQRRVGAELQRDHRALVRRQHIQQAPSLE